MKKLLTALLAVLMVLSLAACGSKETTTTADDKTIDTLSIAFVPSKPAETIMEAAEPLKDLLKAKLAEKGYTVNNIDIAVGDNFAVVGEGMIAGSIDVGFLNSTTYIKYCDGADGVNLLLEALRAGVGDSTGRVIFPSEGLDPWNNGITTDANELANGYAGLVYVNVATEKGADLYEKALAGTLTWEDVDSARWNASSATSGSGFMYPSLWVNELFGEGAGNEKKTIASLSNVTTDVAYNVMMSNLLVGNCDIIVGYADIRKDAESTQNFEVAYADEIAAGTYENVWDVIKIIGVSDFIMNDTISVANESVDEKMTPEFCTALQEAFLELGQTEEGLACVAPYSHKGYQVGQDSDYDGTRAVAHLFD